MAAPSISRRSALLGALGVLGLGAAGVGIDHAVSDHSASERAGSDRGRLADRARSRAVPAGVPSDVPHVEPGRSVTGSFVSAERDGVRTNWTISYPPDLFGATLPVLVVLHATGGDHNSAFDELYLDRFLVAAMADGTAPFAIASVDGGHHQYWHPRRNGNAAGMVIDEFLPLLGEHGLLTNRIGLLGWSMGGYGALYLSTLLGPSRVAAAVAESPAIWTTYAKGIRGAFDDAADFAAHSIFDREPLLKGIPLRIDCGASDPFAPATRALRAALSPPPAGGISPGRHNPIYWRSQSLAELEFIGAHLAQDLPSPGTVNSHADTSG